MLVKYLGDLMGKIKIAIVGVGNCSSLLVQGLEYYKKTDDAVLFPNLGGYRISDIDVVAAFDVDKRKVGKKLSEAVFSEPNNCVKIAEPKSKVTVKKGPVLDGIGQLLKQVVIVGNDAPVDVARTLQDSGAEIVINYLPVGSTIASRFYADEALKAGCGFVNNIPEFLTSGDYAKKFEEAKLPIVGDDMKGTMGASVLTRTLVRLFKDRGVELDRLSQLNFGGNTDFWNLLEEERLKYKRISKTQTVQSMLEEKKLPDYNIKIGPSDYVPWLKSRKVAHIRLEGHGFGNLPIIMDVKLDVDDKSVAAGVEVDAIRCAKLALDRGIGGPLYSISAWTMKSPPIQYPDYVAKKMVEEFIEGKRER
jgi:myo-inositol-1-phosphate synthase